MTSYNLGVRRETSVQVVERIASEAPPRLSDAEDARLVVSFGVNDTNEVNGLPRVSVEEGVRALQAVSQFIVAERVLMVGPPATADSAQNGRIQIRDRALSREAGRLGIRYISTFQATLVDASWQYEVATGDGYHPDSAGYRLLASLIEPALLEWLAPLGRQQRGLCIGS
jgi:lysophospholipase L1-like esterase